MADKLDVSKYIPPFEDDACNVFIVPRTETAMIFDLLLEKISKVEALVEELQQKNHALTVMADESFKSWHRITFGSQAKVDPDVKTAYLDGYRKGVESDKIKELFEKVDPTRSMFSGRSGSPERSWYEETIFNEERLYEVLGKEDARTVLLIFRRYADMIEVLNK